MTKTTLTRKEIHELVAACNKAAALTGVTTKMRYACIRNIRELSKVVESTSKAIPRPSTPRLDAKIAQHRKDHPSREAFEEAVALTEKEYPSDVSLLKEWQESLGKHLGEQEEVSIYTISVNDVGDLLDPVSPNKGYDAGVLMLGLHPMIVDSGEA